ncbi:MAG TPA: thiamine diphosphokinase [Candidatus Faecousia intestinigallinarum]|nr:thiamine diphosphokinase [Candidatus Faecousia intestinigallinarum]
MDTCVIFCAGGFDRLAEPIGSGDLVIAADGGARHMERLGIVPDVVLGDFDSLGYTPKGAAVFPVEKDDTDAMLAIRHGLERGCRRFVLYGALDGPRLDHTVANLQSLQFLSDHGAVGCLVGLTQMATVVENSAISFPQEAKGILSLFCLGREARGVTLRGLQYPLTDAVLTCGFPLGVSNHFIGAEAHIIVKDGSLTAIYDRENGFPRRDAPPAH